MLAFFATYMRVQLASRAGSDRGATATEYAILVAFIAILLIVAAVFLKDSIASLFSRAGSSVTS